MKLHRWTLLVCSTVALATILAVRARPPSVPPRTAPAEVVELTQGWNMRNLVTAIYLGPRIADTVVEVTVVCLAAVALSKGWSACSK